MAYQSWSVVAGEQPTAAKWNILGDNDASFNDGSGIADSALVERHYTPGSVTPPKLGTHIHLLNHQLSSSTGTENITGVPFEPKEVEIFTRRDSSSWSYGAAANNQGGIAQAAYGRADTYAASVSTSHFFLVNSTQSGDLVYESAVTAFNSDGITLNNSITNSNSAVRDCTLIFRA